MKRHAFVALTILCFASVSQAEFVTLNRLSNGGNAVTGYVSAQDGTQAIKPEKTAIDQFQDTAQQGTPHHPKGSKQNFFTFCIDLFHNVSLGQKYATNLRSDLSTAFTNGSRMAYLYNHYGFTNLAGQPDQAAAVQLALWDLSINNSQHHPDDLAFNLATGSISTTDGMFKVTGLSKDVSTIYNDMRSYLLASVGATGSGKWLDASAQGEYRDRGQSLILPTDVDPGPFALASPEPSTMVMGLMASACVGFYRLRRSCKLLAVDRTISPDLV